MTKGIHHITAISSNPQKTYNFYSKILGLRLVKKTVNQDDTETYHLFFGDKFGHPGMDLTFFIFQPTRQGKRGNGLVTTISMGVPIESLDFWENRFKKLDIKHERNDGNIVFFDEDNQKLELVGLENNEIDDNEDLWITDEVSKENAIRSFYSATLTTSHRSLIEPVLTQALGYKFIEQIENIFVYKIENLKRAAFIKIEETNNGEYGISGAGTVHHIAFRAMDMEEELMLRNKLINMGLIPTEVIDRFYFKSVYFRTPSGILFELATDQPGFTADEKENELGKKLALPPFLESQREEIEKNLMLINTD